MAEVSSVFQTKRIGLEALATPGTAVPANRLLQSIGFTSTVKPEIQDFRPDGAKSTSLTSFIRDWTEVAVSGQPTYDEMAYVFAMLFGDGTLTTPTGGVQRRTWYMRNRAPDPIRTFTLDFGYDRYWYRAPYLFLKDFSFKVDNSGIEIDGSGLAQGVDMTPLASSTSASYLATITGSPTGGTFTLTRGAATTSPIAYNATAAAVQTALEALNTVGTGNVAVSGNNGGPYTIAFINDMADVAVTLTGSASFTGGSTPNITVASQTTGTAPTQIPLIPIQTNHVDLYLEDSYAALTGATPISRGFNYEFAIADKADVIKPLRSTVSGFAAHVETPPKVTAKLTLSGDAVGRAMMTTMRTGARKYLRMRANGNIITGAERYFLEITQAVNVMDLSGPEDTDGIFALNWDFAVVNDAAMESGFTVVLQNTLAAL